MEYGVVNSFFDYNTSTRIFKTSLFNFVLYDAHSWKFEKDGKYSVRIAYQQIMNANNDALLHRVAGPSNHIWNLKLPPKVKSFFLRRSCRNCFPTRLRLQSRGVSCQGSCVVCTVHDEDSFNLFFKCNKSIVC